MFVLPIAIYYFAPYGKCIVFLDRAAFVLYAMLSDCRKAREKND